MLRRFKARQCRIVTPRLGVEPLEDRRVLTSLGGIGGTLLGPLTQPTTQSLAPPTTASSIQIITTAVTQTDTSIAPTSSTGSGTQLATSSEPPAGGDTGVTGVLTTTIDPAPSLDLLSAGTDTLNDPLAVLPSNPVDGVSDLLSDGIAAVTDTLTDPLAVLPSDPTDLVSEIRDTLTDLLPSDPLPDVSQLPADLTGQLAEVLTPAPEQGTDPIATVTDSVVPQVLDNISDGPDLGTLLNALSEAVSDGGVGNTDFLTSVADPGTALDLLSDGTDILTDALAALADDPAGSITNLLGDGATVVTDSGDDALGTLPSNPADLVNAVVEPLADLTEQLPVANDGFDPEAATESLGGETVVDAAAVASAAGTQGLMAVVGDAENTVESAVENTEAEVTTVVTDVTAGEVIQLINAADPAAVADQEAGSEIASKTAEAPSSSFVFFGAEDATEVAAEQQDQAVAENAGLDSILALLQAVLDFGTADPDAAGEELTETADVAIPAADESSTAIEVSFGSERVTTRTALPAADAAGLLAGMAADTSTLEQGLRQLRECLEELVRVLAGSGLLPWLMALAATAAAAELARRSLRRTEKDAVPNPWLLAGLDPVSA